MATARAAELLDLQTRIAGVQQDGVHVLGCPFGVLDALGAGDVDDLHETNTGQRAPQRGVRAGRQLLDELQRARAGGAALFDDRVDVSQGGEQKRIHPGGLGRRLRDTVHHVVNDPFRALSHPIRRGIVERLAAGPATVGDATGGFGVSKPAISKHLKVLEETGVVTRVVEGRTHRLSLEPDVLSVAADWMDHQRALWGRLFDVVDEYLKAEGTP